MPTPRLLQPADIPAFRVLRLENLVEAPYASGSTPGNDPTEADGYLERLIESPDQRLIVLDHPDDPTQICAAAGLQRYPSTKTAHRAMIWGVYTTPSMRRRGYARQVLEYTIQAARQWHGLRYLALSVSSTSSGAIALYESLGFVPWGTEPAVLHFDGVDYDETYMALEL